MDNNRDSRSYLASHWKPAPPRVWLWTLIIGAALTAFGLAILLLIF